MTDHQAPPTEPAATAPDTTGPGSSTEPGPAAEDRQPLDLERVAADLDGVEAALGRLDDASYWTDEITGQAIPDDVLAANPVARRADAGHPAGRSR